MPELDPLLTALVLLAAYLVGSLPFALWVTRLVKGVDIRSVGSGHATATNTIRSAGWAAGILVFLLDWFKGFFPTWLALQWGDDGWLAPLVGVLVVVGHCWPVFAGFRGGMGLAAAGGALSALSPAAFVSGLALLVALVLLVRHAARAAIVAALIYPLLLWGVSERWPGLLLQDNSPAGRSQLLLLGVLVSAVTILRFSGDWRRKYKQLWLDRG